MDVQLAANQRLASAIVPAALSVGAEATRPTAQPASPNRTPPSRCPAMHWVVPEIGLNLSDMAIMILIVQ
jgi:hypothetical protein